MSAIVVKHTETRLLPDAIDYLLTPLGPRVPASLPMLPVRVVRTVPRKRNGVSRTQRRGEGHRQGNAIVLRRLLHSEAERVEQEGGQGVGSEGAVHHRGLLRGAVQRADRQQEKGEHRTNEHGTSVDSY